MKSVCTITISLVGLFTANTTLAGQLAESTAVDPAREAFFERQVRPLLVRHCFECHSAAEHSGGLNLESPAALRRGGDSGPAVVPGKPDQSLLIEAIRYENRDLQMPPEGPVSNREQAILEEWVAMGAPDPRREPEGTAPQPVGMSIEDGRKFWAFRPVANPLPPTVQDSDWVRSPIDAFVLARLEDEGLIPAPPADRATLLRRVTFDLIGLPPSPEELEAFLADDSDNAFETVVERLLASPQYGVRWGRHWLDVARYADSNGLDENLAYGQAWRYRDYVIDAFNNNKPFDQFVVEQLAGDLIPQASQETKTATGFLMLGAKVLAEPDMEKLVMDTIDEQLDTTGKAFLGLTLGCARCHDHKFDPIQQRDYYALAAIFKSTRSFADTNTGIIKHWFEHSFTTDEEKELLRKANERLEKLKSAASTFRDETFEKIRREARSQAIDYLVASTEIDVSATLAEVSQAAKQRGLHPRILHHCRRHLEYHRDDSFFLPWHECSASGGPQSVEAHYGPLIEAAKSALHAARKQDSSASRLDDPELEAVRSALYDKSGFLAVPPKVGFAFDEEDLARYLELAAAARRFESQSPDETAAMGVGEQETQSTLPIHIRGSHLNLGDAVAREFPQVMRRSRVRPVFPKSQSGRLQFARWLTSTQHPLTARVFVNRIWGWHFGRALVATTENFGRMGERPANPVLLDWLARNFMESGWSIHDLHRTIVLSNTYRMSSQHPHADSAAEVDPENRLQWRFRLQRLEAEQIRDALLAVCGRLDLSIGGKTVPLRNRQFVFNHTSEDHTRYDSLRRAVYLPVIRNHLYSLFEQFDFPDPTMPTGHRNSTVVAPQSLLMMNSDLVLDCADALASQLMQHDASSVDRIQLAYRRTLSRPPTDAEVSRALLFVTDLTSSAVAATGLDPVDEQRAWAMLCQGLFVGNEFIHLR